MKIWKLILGGILLIGVLLGGWVYIQLRSIDVEKISDDLWVLRGLGGNTAVLRTSEGNVIVDTMTVQLQGARIREVARELTGSNTVMLINSHYHFDHTHGNPAFDRGIRVLSTQRTLEHLNNLDADYWSGDAASLKPNETFSEQLELNIGGQQIILFHPGRGHTDGDLVAYFVSQNAVHLGDLHFNKLYPNIDLEAGGSVQEWPASLDRVIELNPAIVIPGHGATTNKTNLIEFKQFMVQLGSLAKEAADRNLDLDAFVQQAEFTEDSGYEEISFFGVSGLDRHFVLTRAWQEATGNFTLSN